MGKLDFTKLPPPSIDIQPIVDRIVESDLIIAELAMSDPYRYTGNCCYCGERKGVAHHAWCIWRRAVALRAKV